MSRICELTGKRSIVGNHVSHANNKTKRRFYPNLQKKSFFVPECQKTIVAKVCTSALRTINKNGILVCLQDAYKRGTLSSGLSKWLARNVHHRTK